MCKGIYGYLDLETCLIDYIGKDSNIDIKSRHYSHIAPSHYNIQQINRVLQNDPKRYEYLEFETGNFTKSELNELEMDYIKIFNPRFNFTIGGDGNSGIKHSDETKKKISKSKSNTSGYFRVNKHKTSQCKQGFFWRYRYYDEYGKRREIVSVDIQKLEKKVKDRNLEWGRC